MYPNDSFLPNLFFFFLFFIDFQSNLCLHWFAQPHCPTYRRAAAHRFTNTNTLFTFARGACNNSNIIIRLQNAQVLLRTVDKRWKYRESLLPLTGLCSPYNGGYCSACMDYLFNYNAVYWHYCRNLNNKMPENKFVISPCALWDNRLNLFTSFFQIGVSGHNYTVKFHFFSHSSVKKPVHWKLSLDN